MRTKGRVVFGLRKSYVYHISVKPSDMGKEATGLIIEPLSIHSFYEGDILKNSYFGSKLLKFGSISL